METFLDCMIQSSLNEKHQGNVPQLRITLQLLFTLKKKILIYIKIYISISLVKNLKEIILRSAP